MPSKKRERELFEAMSDRIALPSHPQQPKGGPHAQNPGLSKVLVGSRRNVKNRGKHRFDSYNIIETRMQVTS